MNRFQISGRRAKESGMALLECLIYCGLLFVIFWLALESFYRGVANARQLDRQAAQVAKVLSVGERWRADVRLARGPLREALVADGIRLVVPQQAGETVYGFREHTLYRQAAGSGYDEPVLTDVDEVRYFRDEPATVGSWRCELMLTGKKNRPGPKPQFTFQAVPSAEAKKGIQ